MLVLTRQAVPVFDRTQCAEAAGALKGGYVFSKEPSDALDRILIATGYEVQILLDAQCELLAAGCAVRAVSLPSWELFRDQPRTYLGEVLPPKVIARLASEAANPQGWVEWVGGAGTGSASSALGRALRAQRISNTLDSPSKTWLIRRCS